LNKIHYRHEPAECYEEGKAILLPEGTPSNGAGVVPIENGTRNKLLKKIGGREEREQIQFVKLV